MHTAFKLNGIAFKNCDDLLVYAQGVSDELYWFLKDWFQEKPTLSIQTSGSTGQPKLITIAKSQLYNSAIATGLYFDLKEGSKVLCCLSVNYIAGKMMVVRALTLGWHLYWTLPSSTPLKNNCITYDFVAMVPLQVQSSIQDLNRVKKLLIGGAAISVQLKTMLQELETECFVSYGMTETVSHVAIQRLNNLSNNFYEGCYELLPGIQISLDERSCLVIDAPKIANERVVTNDLVEMISDKHFKWLGRIDNVINSGGVKIHAELLEQKLSTYIAVPFMVGGVNDNVLGQKLVLLVESTPFEIDFNQMPLHPYEIPKNVFFLNQFCYTPTQKIQRLQTLDLIKFKLKN